MSWRCTYFLPEEVSVHNKLDDCWLTVYGVVKNVTTLIQQYGDTDLVQPIIDEAGQDVSYWFEMDTFDKPVLKTHLHPDTGARVSLLPFRIPHEPVIEPDVSWQPITYKTPWWQDERYNVGMETVRTIEVRILNTLIKRSVTIKVCLEDSVHRIIERYSVYNPEISSYTVKYVGEPLNQHASLAENGVTLEYDDSIEDYVPTLMLYYHEKLAPCPDLGP